MEGKCDHEENRKKVCGPCGRKIIFGNKKPESFLVSEKLENLIKLFVDNNFDISDSKFPLSICNSCRLALLDREKNDFKRPLQHLPNYQELILRKETRGSSQTCNCYICLTGRYFGHTKVKKGRGHVQKINNVITTDNGLLGASDICKLPQKDPSKIDDKPKKVVTICKNCYQEISKGKRHSCSAQQDHNSCDNIKHIIETLPQKQQEQIATSVIKRKMDTQIETKSKRRNIELKLASKGSASTII